MSKRASPPLLGAFIVGGLLLIALALIVIGARGLFTHQSRLILYFPGSVNGLQVGSAVKFKGVTIGQVASIRISLTPTDPTTSIPVVVELDNSLVASTTGEPINLSHHGTVNSMVEKGLRGSLEMESFVTGMLYVDLNMYTNAPPPRYFSTVGGLPEIPTVQTGLQKLAGSLPKVENILDSVERLSQLLETILKQITMDKLNESVLQTLADARQVMPSLKTTLESVGKMASEFKDTAADLRTDLKPLIRQLTDTAAKAEKTVTELDPLLVDARKLVGDDSPVVNQLLTTLTEFQRTSIALRQLADSLSRNPQSILTGRPVPTESKP